jgi:hypothetical protein
MKAGVARSLETVAVLAPGAGATRAAGRAMSMTNAAVVKRNRRTHSQRGRTCRVRAYMGACLKNRLRMLAVTGVVGIDQDQATLSWMMRTASRMRALTAENLSAVRMPR